MQIVTDHIISQLERIRVWSSGTGTPLPGSITGRVAGPFTFVVGVSDKFKVTVGDADPQTITLTGAGISVQAVADQVNAATDGLNATGSADNMLTLAATEATDPLVIGSIAHNCYAVLGLSVGYRQSVKIYGPGAQRPKGETEYPCITVSILTPMGTDIAEARPHLDVFTASEEQQTIQIPDYMGGGELTGSAEWTWKQFPTPQKISYQLDLEAAFEAHIRAMELMLLEVLPMPHRFEIDGRWALMLPMGDPHNLDELEAPLFRTAYRYEVSNVWIDRQASTTKPSIAEVDMEFGTV